MTPMERAREVCRTPSGDWYGGRELERRVADALTAERERCAKIAQDYHERVIKVYGATSATRGELDASAAIAAAIRQGPHSLRPVSLTT